MDLPGPARSRPTPPTGRPRAGAHALRPDVSADDRAPSAPTRKVRVSLLTPGLVGALNRLPPGAILWAGRPAGSPERGVIARYDGPVRALASSPDCRSLASTG